MVHCSQEMGMSIDIWGPAAWSFLTSAAFAYGKDPEKATSTERMHAKKFFETLPYMLPCSVCRDHYLGHLKKHPVDVTNRDSLSRWIVKIHNIVNVNNGKPVVPYEKVREHYMGGTQWLAPKEPQEMCSLRKKASLYEGILYGVIGLLVVLGIAWGISTAKKK